MGLPLLRRAGRGSTLFHDEPESTMALAGAPPRATELPTSATPPRASTIPPSRPGRGRSSSATRSCSSATNSRGPRPTLLALVDAGPSRDRLQGPRLATAPDLGAPVAPISRCPSLSPPQCRPPFPATTSTRVRSFSILPPVWLVLVGSMEVRVRGFGNSNDTAGRSSRSPLAARFLLAWPPSTRDMPNRDVVYAGSFATPMSFVRKARELPRARKRRAPRRLPVGAAALRRCPDTPWARYMRIDLVQCPRGDCRPRARPPARPFRER